MACEWLDASISTSRVLQMLVFVSSPITVIAAVITVRDSGLPDWIAIALSIICVAALTYALRREVRHNSARGRQ